MTKKRENRFYSVAIHIFYIILCLLALVPILYALNLPLKGEVEHCPLDYLWFQRNLHWIIIKIY